MNNSITDRISFRKLCIICAAYAVFYVFCLYHNNMGITFPVFVTGTVAFFIYYMRIMKLNIKKFSLFYVVAMVAMGIDICITANRDVIAMNKAFIFVLFFMLFLHNLYDDSAWDATKYFTSVCEYVFTSLGFITYPVKDLAKACKMEKNEDDADGEGSPATRSNTWYVLIGLAISVPLVCVILPLLLSSDVIFSNKMDEMFSFVWDFDVTMIVMFVVVFLAAYIMIYRFSLRLDSVAAPVRDKRTHSPIIAITVNVVLLAIYMMYSIIQIVYLFMRKGQLPDGYTYTRYAHEGFLQLVFVCLINIVLVLICRKYSADSTALKIILCMISACTYIMISSSAYRMYLYIAAYKLTFLRIYVLWALMVMAVIMAGVVMYLFKPDMNFVRFATVTFMSLWIMFLCINPDYQIAKYNIRYHDDDDYICELSLDAVAAIERYGNSDELLYKYFEDSYGYNRNIRGKMLNKKMTLRTWNYSIWRAKSIMDAMSPEKTDSDF